MKRHWDALHPSPRLRRSDQVTWTGHGLPSFDRWLGYAACSTCLSGPPSQRPTSTDWNECTNICRAGQTARPDVLVRDGTVFDLYKIFIFICLKYSILLRSLKTATDKTYRIVYGISAIRFSLSTVARSRSRNRYVYDVLLVKNKISQVKNTSIQNDKIKRSNRPPERKTLKVALKIKFIFI